MASPNTEDHAVIYSIDGGKTWEFQGTFGKPCSARSMSQLRSALRSRCHGSLFVRSVPYSKLPEFGLE